MELYEGELKETLTNTIYLNVNNLKKGCYTLRIINKNKVIQKVTFKK
jgi:hypothetical protein